MVEISGCRGATVCVLPPSPPQRNKNAGEISAGSRSPFAVTQLS